MYSQLCVFIRLIARPHVQAIPYVCPFSLLRQYGNLTVDLDGFGAINRTQIGQPPLRNASLPERPATCPLTCELTTNTGYVVYSALGSFYIPMLVMLFFYWRIYRAAVRTTRAINQGFKTTKGERRASGVERVF